MSRPNYVLLLGLDPEHETQDASRLPDILRQAKNSWNQKRNHPRDGAQMLKNLEQYAEIERVLLDPASRRQEYVAARRQQAAEKEAAYQRLDEMLRMLPSQETISKERLAHLCKSLPQLSEADIRARLPLSVQGEELDSVLWDQITSALKIVEQPSLYAVLNLSSEASVHQLQRTAQQLYDTYSQKAHKSSQVTAYVSLAGLCQTVFKTAASKQHYDARLLSQQMESLHDLIAFVGLDGQIAAQSFGQLLEKAVLLGVPEAQAQVYLIQFCQKNNWSYTLPPQEYVAARRQQAAEAAPSPPPKQAPSPPKPPKQKPEPTPIPRPTGPARLSNSLGMDFVWIKPGSFMMGSPDGEGDSDEHPQHPVTLTQGFYLQTTQVTQAQWEAVMGDNPSLFKGDKHRPVESVSWEDVQRYLTKLNQRGEGQYRLPTEAEWEYACRAGSTTAYCFGNDVSRLGEYAWFGDNSGKIQNKWFGLKQKVTDQKTHPVAQKKPNAWGLYDMHGNVWEWVQDWYGPYGSGAQTNPTGPSTGESRVYRGGSWSSNASNTRCSYRFTYNPDDWFFLFLLGFRLVRSS